MVFGVGRFLARFAADRRGTSFEGIALSISIMAVAFVASADMLDYMTRARAPSQAPAMAQVAKIPKTGDDLDKTPTASMLPRLVTRSVLDPCTGTEK